MANNQASADHLLTTALPYCDYHEDRGPVLWWLIPVTEAPYVGSPGDLGRKEQHHITDELSLVIDGVGGWPFLDGDERRLWWTLLPDGMAIEDQVPL